MKEIQTTQVPHALTTIKNPGQVPFLALSQATSAQLSPKDLIYRSCKPFHILHQS